MLKKKLISKGKRISYRVTGTGPTILLVHGFGEDGTVWNNQVEFLKNDYRLIVPDLPGSGNSEMIDDMSIEGMAEVLKKIIDEETAGMARNPKFCLFGHSMGGYITLAFAEKYPHWLNGFGLVHSTTFPDNEEKKAARKKGIEFIKTHGGFEFLKISSPNLFSPPSKNEKPELVDQFVHSLRNFKAAPLISYYEAMMQRPDRSAVLQNINVAVLLIAGEFDNAVPLKDALQQFHLANTAHAHVLKNSAHMGMMEEVQRINQILKEYLSFI